MSNIKRNTCSKKCIWPLVAVILATVAPNVFAFSSFSQKSFLKVPHYKESSSSSTSLLAFFKGKDYDRVVEGIMATKGLSREEAEKDYNAYLENPTNYALNKGEAYYKSLGYKSLMDGVVGEAEKEGRGDEVRERIDAFKKQSQLKATGVLVVFFALFFYIKLTYVPELGQ